MDGSDIGWHGCTDGSYDVRTRQAVELSRVKDGKSLDFFFKEVDMMRVRPWKVGQGKQRQM